MSKNRYENIAKDIAPGEADMASLDALARRLAVASPQERARYEAAHPELRRLRVWAFGLLAVALLLGLLTWAAFIADAAQQQPGDLAALFGGIWNGLLVMVIVVFCVFLMPVFPLMKWLAAQNAAAPIDSAHADPELAPMLAELQAAREQAQGQMGGPPVRVIKLGALIGGLAGLGFFLWMGVDSANYHPQHVFGPLGRLVGNLALAAILVGVGMSLGITYGLKRAGGLNKQLAASHDRLYRERVLPMLAARLGAFTVRPAQPPLDAFNRLGLFAPWDAARPGSEIAGNDHGLPLSLFELTLENGAATVFAGLVAVFALPRGVSGVTVVTPKPESGGFDALAERLRAHAPQPLQALALQDAAFDKRYRAQTSDEPAARALLTPALLQGFMALKRLGVAALLAQGERLILTVSLPGERDFFAPPPVNIPSAAQARLAQLLVDIAALLRVADAVVAQAGGLGDTGHL